MRKPNYLTALAVSLASIMTTGTVMANPNETAKTDTAEKRVASANGVQAEKTVKSAASKALATPQITQRRVACPEHQKNKKIRCVEILIEYP